MARLLLYLLISICFSGASTRNGSDRKIRWSVKTVEDLMHDTILAPNHSTIMEQRALELDTIWSVSMPRRVDECLMTLKCNLESAKLETDGDYHLILTDSGKSIIGEIPEPATNRSEFWSNKFGLARAVIDSLFSTKRGKKLGRHWRTRHPIALIVTGFGFWDKALHGKGASPNRREIHPIIQILRS